MANRLAGCLVKLDRAGAHLRTLAVVADDLFGTAPEWIPGEFEAASGDYVFRARRTLAVPLAWSGVVGDVVHNLYAALDYLAWELVAANGGTGNTSTAFPIFQDRSAYSRGATRKTAGMHEDACAVIEQLQPFQVSPRDGHPNDHPLTWLYELERRDKHRTLNLTVNVGDVTLHGFLSDVHQAPGPFRFPFGPIQVGDVLTRVKGLADGPQMTLQLKVNHGLVFDNGGPCAARDVRGALDEIKRHIEMRVLPPLRRFL